MAEAEHVPRSHPRKALMVRLRTPVLCFLLALVVLALTGRAALAAAPSNDTFGGATPISSLPFHDTTGTTEATVDADDTAVGTGGASGGAGQASPSVWYAYPPSTTPTVKLDTTDSSYTVGAGIVTGSPGNL